VVGTNEDYLRRKPNGMKTAGATAYGYSQSQQETDARITAPATPEAQQWDGWGTALKPAVEPITVARKPLQGTVAENVLTFGTGGINIDGCRVGTEEIKEKTSIKPERKSTGIYGHFKETQRFNGNRTSHGLGRFPANLIHDGSEEVVGMFPDTRAGAIPKGRFKIDSKNGIYGKFNERENKERVEFDSGSAARFFYQAKADKGERGQGNTHPTVKPIDLMRYLCRLVTPPGGVVYDPFTGSGTTLIAAHEEGFNWIGSEMTKEYWDIAVQRIKEHTAQQKLF
jgi:site-specific DNA-methyltransferase (adenine-specific)